MEAISSWRCSKPAPLRNKEQAYLSTEIDLSEFPPLETLRCAKLSIGALRMPFIGNPVLFLRVSYWVGAIADGLAGIRMLIPTISDSPEYRYALALGAALMFGWACQHCQTKAD